MLRSGFAGSPDIAVPSLLATSRVTNLAAVVTQPDKPAGRGRRLTAPPVKQAALALGLPVLQPTKMRDGELASQLRMHQLDILVVVAFGRILPPEILELPRYGCINVHFSLLPRWRGAAPVQRSVLAGDAETGVTIMKMDEGLDTGPVYRMDSLSIGATETSGELFPRLAALGAESLRDFLSRFPAVDPPRDQNSSLATHAAMLEKSEGRIDWHRPAAELVNHVRGMDPWPGAFTCRGEDRLKVFRATLGQTGEGGEPGTVLGLDEGGLLVATGSGVLRLEEVQPSGGKRMLGVAYAGGRPFGAGERLGGGGG